MPLPPLAIRAATDRDLEAITETLTLAFADDPVWGGWAFPDRAFAFAQRRSYFQFGLRGALQHQWVRVTENCEAVAAWIPPGRSELTPEGERQLASVIRTMLGPHAALFLQGAELFLSSHPQDRPHYYLSLLGTHDAHRGKGLGMALLRECLSLIDEQGMPAYLESTNPRNVFRYEQLGFDRVGSFDLPGGGPTVDRMWRESMGRVP